VEVHLFFHSFAPLEVYTDALNDISPLGIEAMKKCFTTCALLGIVAFSAGCESFKRPFTAFKESVTSSQDEQTQEMLDNLTPNMHGLAETHAENDAGVAMTKDTEWRQFDDDIRRALMLDRPSSLSPYPVVND